VPPYINLGFVYYDGYTYGTIAGSTAATLLTVVVGNSDTASSADLGCASPCVVVRDAFFDSAFSARYGHEHVVRGGHATAGQPVWDIDLAARRAYINQWERSAGALFVSSRSVGMLGDARIWAESAPAGWTQQPTATVTGDPHMKGAHGGEADFRGQHGKVYNLLSARNVSVNALFEHRHFVTPYSKVSVNGSWVMAVYISLDTSCSTLSVAYGARAPHRATLQRRLRAPPRVQPASTASSAPQSVLPAQFSITDGPAATGARLVDGVRLSLLKRTLRVEHPFWRVSVEATSGHPHLGQKRINVKITPTYAVDLDRSPRMAFWVRALTVPTARLSTARGTGTISTSRGTSRPPRRAKVSSRAGRATTLCRHRLGARSNTRAPTRHPRRRETSGHSRARGAAPAASRRGGTRRAGRGEWSTASTFRGTTSRGLP